MNIKRFYRWLPLFAALFSVAELSAQSQLVSFPSLRMTATEAMQTIEQQTGLTFSYNSAVFDTSSEVAFPATELSLEQAMSRIVKEKYLNFMFRGQYIIVYPDSAAKPAAPQPVNNRTSDVYEQTPANSRDTAPLRRPEVEEAPAPEPPAPIVRRVLAPGPDPSAFYSDYKDIDRFDRNGKHLPKWALKMNLLYAAGTLTPNLALEMGINDRMSVVLAGSYNPWNRIGTLENNDKIVHFAVHPQFRYWFCERFNGHFLSAGPFYNQFNVS
jgi:hypothetical protein